MLDHSQWVSLKSDTHQNFTYKLSDDCKEQQKRPQLQNYLSFGPSRKTMEYTAYGNDVVIVKKSEKLAENSTASVSQTSTIKRNAACSII